MKQKTVFSLACIFSLVYTIYSLDLFEIKDKKYLNSVNKIAIVQVDTVPDFSGDLPQGYYVNLFLSMLSLGMNGITAFEMVTDSAAANMLLYVKFLTLFYSSKKNPQASNISYTTKATIQITGYAPGTRREVFIMKHTGSSSSYTLPDELKDNIIEIGDNVVKAFSELKETAARKSFYVNTISCKELADKKISFILLGNKKNPSFKKLADIIDAELQGYFYNKKMKVQKPDRATDSLVNLNRDSIRFNELYSVFNNTVIDHLNKVSLDYLLVVNNLTSFEGDETPAGTLVAKYFSFYSDYGMRMKAATAAAMSHNYTGGMALAGGLIETISAMSVINNMNSYGRISCEVCFVDVKKNQILLKNQLYVIEGIGPKSTPADLAAKIGSQMRDCDLHVTDVTLSTAGKKSDNTIPTYGFKSASCDQQWGKIIGSFSLLAGGTALLIIGGAINKEDSPSGAPFFILGALSITGSIPLGIVGGIKQARYFECRKRYQ